MRNLEGGDREKLVMVLGNREASRDELEQAAKLVIASGAIDYAESKAKEYIDRALEALRSVVPENEYRKMLEELAKFVATRTW